MATPRKQLADQLKYARVKAGYDTQSALARETGFSRGVISKAENEQYPPPSVEVVTAWAKATRRPLDPLVDLIRRCKSGTPDWFMPYAAAEAVATSLRFWGALIVPGALQTEAYARAVLEIWGYTGARLAELLEARMARQAIIGRARIIAVLDSTVLERCIGSPQIMADQCDRLAKLMEDHSVRLHIVPKGTNVGLGGACAIATVDGVSTVSWTTILRDVTSTAPDVVEGTLAEFEQILGASLPEPQSLDSMLEHAQAWRNQA